MGKRKRKGENGESGSVMIDRIVLLGWLIKLVGWLGADEG